MGKKVIKTVTRQLEDEDDDSLSLPRRTTQEVETDPAEISYTDFVAKNRGAKGCRVKVYRETPRGRQYCFFGSPEEISDEYIRQHHAKQPYASEEGHYVLVPEVNGETRDGFPVYIAPQVGTPGTAQEGGGQSGGMAELVRGLQAQNERLERMLLERERTPMVEMFDCMLKLDQLRGGQQPQQLPIESLMKAVEIGRSLNPTETETWNGLLMSTLKDNAPMILEMLNRFVPKPAQAAQVPPPGQPVQERISETMSADAQEQGIFKEIISFLKVKAVRNSDPNLYIEVVVDNREDPLYAKLIREITTKEFSEFAAIDPEISQPQYVGFFHVIYDGIRSLFTPKGTVAASTDGKAGNKKHTPPNGATGKTGA